MADMKQAGLRWGAAHARKLGWIAGGVAVVWGGLWLGLPGVVAHQLEQHASQALGRAVTVRSVDVSPWSLALTVHGLEVAGLPGQAPALSVERVHLNASSSSLWRLAPVLDALELDQPVVRVVQDGRGHWDFEDVLHKLQTDAKPSDPEAAPARFALYNIQLRGGRLELDDQQAGVQHRVEALQLQLPFISTLASQRTVKVQPQLSLLLNGSEIASQAVGTPFDATHSSQARLEIRQFDLAPYAPYLPASVPLQLQQGRVDAEILVAFEQTTQPTVQLQGSQLRLSDLKVQDRSGQPLAGWSQLSVDLGDTRPLQQQVRVSSLTLNQPFVQVHRRADGGFLPGLGATAPKGGASLAGQTSEKTAVSPDWQLLIDQFHIENGRADWRDDQGQVGAVLRVDDLQLQAQAVAWPLAADGRWQLSAQLQGEDRAARGQLRSWGQGTLERGQAAVLVDKLDAHALQAYANQWLRVPVGGLTSLTAGVAWNQGYVHAQVPALAVESVALGQAASPEVAWTGLQLRNMRVDVAQQRVQVEHIALEAPMAKVQRNAQGRWMYEQWLQPVVGAPVKGRETVQSQAGKPWHVLVQDMELAAGRVELHDASLGAQPLAIQLSEVQLQMRNVDSVKGTAQAQLSARMAERTRRGGWGVPGKLTYQGLLQLDPLLTKGRVQLQSLPLQAFEPYMAPYLNVRLVRALASFDGDVHYAQRSAGAQLQLQGQARVNDVHVQTVAGDMAVAHAVQGSKAAATLGAEDLLRWKQLSLQGLHVQMQPAQPPHIQVRSTELKDFYARVVVLPEGRLNLQNLMKSNEVPVAEGGQGASDAASVVEVAQSSSKSTEPAVQIDMGPMALHGGVIKFSDYFIQPNYTADLTSLQGSLEAFASQPAASAAAPALAKLVLEGVAQGSAQLLIDGDINPLAQPLAMNVRAQVKGLDLSPLTPYAIKYAGHGIEKGKLSMDVRYQIQPDGQLTATNQLVLNQLSFSDPVEGAPTSLPVRLAVALLADSQGVIDLNLPISGSLNDPQFRVAPVVFKIIGNIIRKAVTAPFSLLTGAFAAGDDRSDIVFEAGRSSLNAAAQEQLQKLAAAMQNKPQLKLTLMGQVNPDAEAEGWKQARLERLVIGDVPSEKSPEGVVGGSQSASASGGRTERQQQAALKQIYRKTVKERPRNMVGLAKDLPPQEMQALIVQDMVIPAGAWSELAAERAQTVRDYLVAQGVDVQRVFLGRVGAHEGNADHPAVLLNISVQ